MNTCFNSYSFENKKGAEPFADRAPLPGCEGIVAAATQSSLSNCYAATSLLIPDKNVLRYHHRRKTCLFYIQALLK
jgi:hypothetical protein